MNQKLNLGAIAAAAIAAASLVACGGGGGGAAPDESVTPPPAEPLANATLSADKCNSSVLGTHVLPADVSEDVSGVTLNSWTWVDATATVPAHCRVDGSIHPMDFAAPNINFRVVLPDSYSHRYVQVGGSGMNGSIQSVIIGERNQPAGDTTFLARGWTVAGSDGGHQSGNAWTLNDESVRNLGYMQMSKTHDVAQVLIQRAYNNKPLYKYFVGRSQGGREALMVAQTYPELFNGIISVVPIVNYSSLMLGPTLVRIQEKPLANWIPPAKRTAIATEVIRQCDGLDNLMDGIINNYQACRAVFDVTAAPAGRQPWATKRCPGNVDPAPADTTANACLTDGQISTLEFTYSRYTFATPLANGNRTFGMWLPGTDPGGSGLIDGTRYQGQEGAAPGAPMQGGLGIAGVTGILMQNLSANPLDYVEGGVHDARRVFISRYLDATNPDLSAFKQRGGKIIMTGATKDTLASSGSHLDYFQSVLDKMGQGSVDEFARMYVFPMIDHNVAGNNFNVNGNGATIPVEAIPVNMNRVQMMVDWVEKGTPPPKHATVTSATKALPLCSFPAYPRYRGAAQPTEVAESYECVTP